MTDLRDQIGAIDREVRGGESVAVLLRRSYPATPDDLWEALTDPDRIKRWFLPISGDLRVGGSFQLEGNAGGEILECERPKLIRVTFGGPESLVELRLTAEGPATVLQLEHTVPLAMAGSTAGALFVGPGWDGAFLGLALHFDGVEGDPVEAANSLEVQRFNLASIQAWTAAASGSATDEQIAEAAGVARAQYAPDVS
ncbi:SRPBCC family protein [Nonomuraea sp. NPDC050556]|uniref:SRPBCC family protein n=1 Tax=Nonomuraea sp. NPDC050556 TaxID=3364369 RepID=UPI0037987842